MKAWSHRMIKFTSVLLMAMVLFISPKSFGGLLFTYQKLVLKDLEDMSKLVQGKIKESKKTSGDKTVPLKEALQAVFSRPDDDNTIDKVISPLKNELDRLEAWEQTLEKLVDEALGALKNPSRFRKEALVTYEIFFKNLLETELNPRIDSEYERGLIKKIRDAKVELTKEAEHKGALDIGKAGFNPSQAAAKLLEMYDQKLESERKAKEQAAKAEKQKKAKEQSSESGSPTPTPSPNDSYL